MHSGDGQDKGIKIKVVKCWAFEASLQKSHMPVVTQISFQTLSLRSCSVACLSQLHLLHSHLPSNTIKVVDILAFTQICWGEKKKNKDTYST